MRKTAKLISTATTVAVLLGSLALTPVTSAVAASAVEEGKKLAFDRKKGNCLACHDIKGTHLPGNMGPPLFSMKDRFPDKSKMRAQIWDATKNNPNTSMPPFGRHQILSDSDINKIAEYIYTL